MIEVQSVSKSYKTDGRILRAVKDVSLQIGEGEILGLVGESGCGKSTLGRMLARLEPPSSGQILFQNQPLQKASRRDLQMIFQDPFSSLNPRMTVAAILSEPTRIHRLPERVDELLDLVGLPKQAKHRFPHEFSGGQKQRIGIARALALKPKFLVCDEPVSALDVSIQAQILNLLQSLQRNLKLTYLFISHDLAVVRHFCARIAVMYHGSIVEIGPAEKIFSHPLHPYTRLLLDSTPLCDPLEERRRERPPILGEPLSPLVEPSGCPFAPRCRFAQPQCLFQKPQSASIDDQTAACHLLDIP